MFESFLKKCLNETLKIQTSKQKTKQNANEQEEKEQRKKKRGKANLTFLGVGFNLEEASTEADVRRETEILTFSSAH